MITWIWLPGGVPKRTDLDQLDTGSRPLIMQWYAWESGQMPDREIVHRQWSWSSVVMIAWPGRDGHRWPDQPRRRVNYDRRYHLKYIFRIIIRLISMAWSDKPSVTILYGPCHRAWNWKCKWNIFFFKGIEKYFWKIELYSSIHEI